MSSNYNRWYAVAVAFILALYGQYSAGAGMGHAHHPPAAGMGHAYQNGPGFQSGLPSYANSWPYLRAENGVFGPVWAAPGPGGRGFGGAGVGGFGYGGAGWGWGYGLGDYGYYPYDLPYFDLFPPVYYTYSKGAIVPSATLNAPSPGNGNSAAEATVPPPPVPQTTPPLRIINPYYTPR